MSAARDIIEIDRTNEMPARANGNAVTPMDMIDRALSSGADPDTLAKLLALQERWEANQGRKAFDEAMAAAKAEIPVINKSREVDFISSKGRTHYRYEDLAEVARTVNPILSKHGLSYRFRTTSNANEPVSVTCIVSHRLGYSEENTLVGPRDDSGNKNSLQQVGSTLTYLQRMTLKAALGLAAAEDDDGASSAKPAGNISSDQRVELQRLIETLGWNVPDFCTWAKINALPDMASSNFPKAKQALETKIRQKGAAK